MEKIYTDAQTYFTELIEDIRLARHSVDMEVYIFERDQVGQQVLRALCDAASRGVAVRLLVDGIGSPRDIGGALMQLHEAGGEGRIFHPLPWRFWHWALAATRVSPPAKFWYLLGLMNRRNHRKTTVIDGETVWLGSFNISLNHLPDKDGGRGWHDVAVRMNTVNADELKQAFDMAWHPPAKIGGTPATISGQFRLNYTRHLRRMHYKGMLRHLGQAHHRIWITNAYFLPEAKLMRALRIAARRGVDVRMLLPARSDVFFMPWASARFYVHLLNDGVRIFEYEAGVLHAKTLVMDHWVTVGSSNLNQRSLHHDLEVDAVLYEKQAVQKIERLFLHNQMSAQEIVKGAPIHHRWWQRLFGRLALLLRYWM